MEHIEKQLASLRAEHGNNKYMMGALHAYENIYDELNLVLQKLEAKRVDYWRRSDELLNSETFMFSVALISRSDAYNDAMDLLGRPKRIPDGKCRMCGRTAKYALISDQAITFCEDHFPVIDDRRFYQVLEQNPT